MKKNIPAIQPGNNKRTLHHIFEKFSTKATAATGSTFAFIIALSLVIAWGIMGPVFHYSEDWQMVINTGTTIITFLMVFLIQKSQNKDSLAVQLKLNELVAAHEFASNRLVDVECLTEDELKVIKKYYSHLSEISKKEETLQQSHSIDEADQRHHLKRDLEDGLEIKNSRAKNAKTASNPSRKKQKT